jgi:hypothetical protein
VTGAPYSGRVPRLLLLLLLASCATRRPAELVLEPVPRKPSRTGIAWRLDGEPALLEARAKGRPALLYFTAHW